MTQSHKYINTSLAETLFGTLLMSRWLHIYLLFPLLLSFSSCKKLVEIDPPSNFIVAEQVFSDSSSAAAAIAGAYLKLSRTSFFNSRATLNAGMYADELIPFVLTDFYTNTVNSASSSSRTIWNDIYGNLLQINACIEGIQKSSSLSSSAKNHFLGEAKFLRAFCYFYLTNLFGDVPYVSSSDWVLNSKLPRVSQTEIYEAIIADLFEARESLVDNYDNFNGERIRANKWVATAFLARVYLYTGKWENAEEASNSLITEAGLFSLQTDLNNVFIKNNEEAILQWNNNPSHINGNYNVTWEGLSFNPSNPASPPQFYLSSYVVSAFESGDMRKIAWTKSTDYRGNTYQYPYKYKDGGLQRSPGSVANEHYTILRLAEQYLIRAEARIQQNKIVEGIEDLNIIRQRATDPAALPTDQLIQLPTNLSKEGALEKVTHERRVELFAEWGHRWFDLKRTGNVDAIMSVVSPTKNGGIPWDSFRQLLPIPQNEMLRNPFLTQNSGYN